MKHLLYSLFIGGVLLLSSCSDFTDMQPKGKNLLSTTDELEMLLNNEFDMSATDMREMCGDEIYAFENIPTLLSRPDKTRLAILFSWDEANQDKMAELTTSDTDYSNWYGVIGTIANPVLSCVDAAKGNDAVKNQLKCEALTLRAYFHYLLVNKFAKAYNPATAASDPGIPYILEDWDITVPSSKVSVKEVYDHIIADVDEAIRLDALPVNAVNRMRMSKSCPYAVKALALISMQKFDEAEEAAKQALSINGNVNNYNEMLTTLTGYIIGGKYPVILRPRLKCEEDLFYIHNIEFFSAITTEAWSAFEKGHACKEKMSTDRLMYDNMAGMGITYIGLDYTFTYDLNSGWNTVGMKTTQMYLIIAEAEMRKGNFDTAMDALDAIRVNRIDPAVYKPLKGTVNTLSGALFHLKQTSHGENIYSCYNFINKKRWNQLEDSKTTITKDVAGTIYSITPDSPMWIFPFPQNVINNNPNITQNYK